MLRYWLVTDPDDVLLHRPKTHKDKIAIETDENGNPKIPSVTVRDKIHVKVLQTMLRDYCTAHIREYQGILHISVLICVFVRVYNRNEESQHLMVKGMQHAIGLDIGRMLSRRLYLGRPIQDP